MGVNLGGESPLYENRRVFMIMDTNKSTSRRQWRFREGWSEGSRSANVRDDGQKPHIRLSLRASQPHMAKPIGSGDRVNAAFVHGKFTFLSGEICLTCVGAVMSKGRKGFIRLSKNPAYSVAVDRYESRITRETQNRRHLMTGSGAPSMVTCQVSKQKSADGIVPADDCREGPNVEMSGASNELDVGVESERISQISARHGIAFPRFDLSEKVCAHCRFESNPATAR